MPPKTIRRLHSCLLAAQSRIKAKNKGMAVSLPLSPPPLRTNILKDNRTDIPPALVDPE